MILIANWKSQKTIAEVERWFVDYQKTIIGVPAVEVVVAPQLVHLAAAREALAATGLPLNLAAQDVSQFPFGKYTGAVAASAFLDFSLSHCIVGHSERRRYFAETDGLVAQKIRQLLDQNITPIVCVDDSYLSSLASQLPVEDWRRCLITYERAENIGTGEATAQSVVAEQVARIKSEYAVEKVLYGGSVSAANIVDYARIVDGFLVGSASLSGRECAQLAMVAASAPH